MNKCPDPTKRAIVPYEILINELGWAIATIFR